MQHFLFEGAASFIPRKLLRAVGESIGTLAEPMVRHVLRLDMLMAVDAHEVPLTWKWFSFRLIGFHVWLYAVFTFNLPTFLLPSVQLWISAGFKIGYESFDLSLRGHNTTQGKECYAMSFSEMTFTQSGRQGFSIPVSPLVSVSSVGRVVPLFQASRKAVLEH